MFVAGFFYILGMVITSLTHSEIDSHRWDIATGAMDRSEIDHLYSLYFVGFGMFVVGTVLLFFMDSEPVPWVAD